MTELEQHELYEGDDVCLVRHAAECCLVIGVSIDSCATQVPQFLLPLRNFRSAPKTLNQAMT